MTVQEMEEKMTLSEFTAWSAYHEEKNKVINGK
jgi:hypothetical protein